MNDFSNDSDYVANSGILGLALFLAMLPLTGGAIVLYSGHHWFAAALCLFADTWCPILAFASAAAAKGKELDAASGDMLMAHRASTRAESANVRSHALH